MMWLCPQLLHSWLPLVLLLLLLLLLLPVMGIERTTSLSWTSLAPLHAASHDGLQLPIKRFRCH